MTKRVLSTNKTVKQQATMSLLKLFLYIIELYDIIPNSY